MIRDNFEILVRLHGGLGNQLFQMFAGLKVSKLLSFSDLESKVILNTKYLQAYKQPRNFEIGFIADNFQNIIVGESVNTLLNLSAQIRLAKIMDKTIGRYAFISSVGHIETLTINNANKILLDGYFQDPVILPSEEERLFLRDNLVMKYKELISSVHCAKKTVGVHIRRGDYNSTKQFRILSLDYYRSILGNYFISDEYNIFIFSDDPVLAESFADEVAGVNVSKMNLSLEEEFCLLAACNNYIIANSTFSWWASYIGRLNDSQIFAPKIWYSDERQNNLLLEHFKLM